MLKVNKEKIVIFLSAIFFKITLEYIYLYILPNIIHKIYMLNVSFLRKAYYFNFDTDKYIISWGIFYLFLYIFVEKILFIGSKQNIGQIILGVLFFMSFIPNIILFSFSNIEFTYLFLFLIYWGIFFTTSHILFKINYLSKKRIKYSKLIITLMIVFFIVFSLLISYYYNNFKIYITIEDSIVYFKRFNSSFPKYIDCFRNTAMFIIIPIILVYFLKLKKILFFSITVYIQLLLYSLDLQKTAVFLMGISIFGFIYYKNKTKIMCSVFLNLLGINIITIIFYKFFNNLFFLNHVMKRIYFLPAIISNCYFLYVNKYSNVVPFSTIFQRLGLIENYYYKYQGLPYHIGQEFFGNIKISANTGGFGNAFSYGIIGVILIPICYAIILKILNIVTVNLELSFLLPIIVSITFLITGTSLISILAIYGLPIGIVLLKLFNDLDSNRINKRGIK